MPFAIPMQWREPHTHDDCYFCRTQFQTNFSKASKKSGGIIYLTVPSAVRPVSHEEAELPVPTPPPILPSLSSRKKDVASVESSDKDSATSSDDREDREFLPSENDDSDKPRRFDQESLSDLVRDLQLGKRKSELLASRLK